MKSVLDVKDGDLFGVFAVPDTRYAIEPIGYRDGRGGRRVAIQVWIDGRRDEELSLRIDARFEGRMIDAALLRCIAGWLREGAPD